MIKLPNFILILILPILVFGFLGFSINKWIIKDANRENDIVYTWGGIAVGCIVLIVLYFLLYSRVDHVNRSYLLAVERDIQGQTGIYLGFDDQTDLYTRQTLKDFTGLPNMDNEAVAQIVSINNLDPLKPINLSLYR